MNGKVPDLMPRFKPKNIFEGTSGLNNRVAPDRAPYDYRSNLRAVTQSNNVMSDDTGRLDRVPGFAKRLSGAFHSLWTWKRADIALVVKDGVIGQLDSGLNFFEIKMLANGNLPVCFCGVDIGGNLDVYWANGEEKGIIRDRTARNWGETPYPGQTPTDRYFQGPPDGNLLAYWNGRMMIGTSTAGTIYFSEPYSPGCFDLNENRLHLHNEIRLMAPTQGGCWLGDDRAVYWMAGRIAPAAGEIPRLERRADYPALFGAATAVDMSDFGGSGEAWIAGTLQGICLLGPDGSFKNLTADNIEFRDEDNRPIRSSRGSAWTDGGRSFFSFF